ncbi:MAG: hypothetical protein EHM57_06750 [Actinobacteria bacterium]|nr:MAG: hypothetical protein EHM57_06750 [Actinomycetota bacterium]
MRWIDRRQFLSRAWKAGVGLLAVAAAWTSWDLLKPKPAAGYGAAVSTVSPDAVPEDTILEITAARAYLTKVNGDVVALSEKCTHLGCRVPFCDSSGQFECPCHGSVFNRAGDFLSGPAPRGMDRYGVSVVEGVVVIDTSDVIMGAPPGTQTIDEPARGPSCTEGAG